MTDDFFNSFQLQPSIQHDGWFIWTGNIKLEIRPVSDGLHWLLTMREAEEPLGAGTCRSRGGALRAASRCMERLLDDNCR